MAFDLVRRVAMGDWFRQNRQPVCYLQNSFLPWWRFFQFYILDFAVPTIYLTLFNILTQAPSLTLPPLFCVWVGHG